MRIAVCLHLYYVYLFSEIKEYLLNLQAYKYQLFITMPIENQFFEKKLIEFDPNVIIIYTKNVGFDIFPFIIFLEHINISDYDLIIKLHSKKNIPGKQYINKNNLYGDNWRYYLFNSILGSQKKITKILELFRSDSSIGLVGSKELLISGNDVDKDIDINAVHVIMNQCGLEINRKEFIAGSIFVIRANLLNPIKNRHFSEEDFPPYFPRDWNSLPYCLERCFGFIVSSQNFQLIGIKSQFRFSRLCD